MGRLARLGRGQRSDPFKLPLTPDFPDFQPLSIETSVLTGRGSLAANYYTLRFSDGFSGSQSLRGLITVVTPEPTTILLAAATLPLLRRRRA